MSMAHVSPLSMSAMKSVSVIVVAPAPIVGAALNVQVPATFTLVAVPPTAVMPVGSGSDRSMLRWLLTPLPLATVNRIVLVPPTSIDAGVKSLPRAMRAPTASVSLPPVVSVGVWFEWMAVTVLV